MSAKLQIRGDRAAFFCPGCNLEHEIRFSAGGWTWNQSLEAPTFMPSVLARSGHYAEDRQTDKCWCTYAKEHPNEPVDFHCYRCHSFVKDGKIRFLEDCSHALAGQTVDLPDWRER
jgi:hypothetical protein